MNALDLPVEPGGLRSEHAARLDEMHREVASRLDSDTPATIDENGELRVAALVAVPDPPSLVDLRRARIVTALSPSVVRVYQSTSSTVRCATSLSFCNRTSSSTDTR
ncbi:hypothetical protein [Nocardia sp. NPDC052112]|uniref:hypothetical protein n=1 Tax=Nocardia sp. NPDC052112 TaxID=3155646 RepID=UPI0034404D54